MYGKHADVPTVAAAYRGAVGALELAPPYADVMLGQ